MNYQGDIIEESLTNKDVLKSVNIIATRIEPVTPDHKTPWLKQWTLHTIDVGENDAASLATMLSKVVEHSSSGHGNWYIDFKNDTTHYVIFPHKVFKVDRSQPQQYKAVVAH